jgi:hypothetical protein
MKHQNTAEFLKIKMNKLIREIKEADAKYWRWCQKGRYQLALSYKEELDRLFKELADVNIAFLMETTRDQLNRISTCAVLAGMGVAYNEVDGSIYL